MKLLNFDFVQILQLIDQVQGSLVLVSVLSPHFLQLEVVEILINFFVFLQLLHLLITLADL